MSDELKHYGILRKSGRYPWGSGKDAYQRSMDFYAYTNKLKESGFSAKEIATAIGLQAPDSRGFSIADLRDTTTIAKEQVILEQTRRVQALKDKGHKPATIATMLDLPPATVRLRLKNGEERKESSLRKTAEILRKNVDEHDIVDIGKGVGVQMGISPERLRAATSVLRDEGYETYQLKIKNVGTNHLTNHQVIVPPGTGYGNAYRMRDKIHTMGEWTEDDGLTYFGIHPPISISSKRLQVNFAEDGGTDSDGVVFVRPGVPDLDMGKNNYAQVRIMVDGDKYIKGMAVLKDDLPDGVDLVFNTNKSRSAGKLGALKEVKKDSKGNVDQDNPFGSMIKRQIVDIDPKTGKERVKSALNIVNEEGDWDDWRTSVPSQVLAKQPHSLIKSQLKVTRDDVRNRLAEIEQITNPVVRKKKLEDFADQIDSDAVELRAAAMPGQRTQVLIPVPQMRKNEIYAPRYETGDEVVLIRYPHGGRFEIPEVVVNNNNRTAKKLLGNAFDAIGIHPSVAEKLSGADFDGDTVAVIPNRSKAFKGLESMGSAKAYYEKELGSFDPKKEYGGYKVVGTRKKKDGTEEEIGNFPLMKNTGLEMGKITNLITDMSIQGAKPEHIVRAVRHSMVVIDAEKHKLDYRASAIQNGISQLTKLYQATPMPDGTVKYGGASTLLSKATAEVKVPQRKLRSAKDGGPIDPDTGEQVWVPTGRTTSKYDPKTKTYLDEKVPVKENVARLALTKDAFSLTRDKSDPVEKMYAEHANEMKSIANEVRLKAARTKPPLQNKEAKVVYKDEVDKLLGDLKKAVAQKPLERRADVIAGITVKAKREEDPLLRTDKDRLKKVERQAKAAARARLGLTRPVIDISDRQWDAIQSGAVSASKLREVLEYADPKRVETLAMPRKNTVMTSAVSGRAKAMLAAGRTTAEVARELGIPESTLSGAIKRGEV